MKQNLRHLMFLSAAIGAVAAAPARAADVDVLLLAGQSNAVGYGSDANELPPELYAPQTDILLWFEEGPWNSVDNPSLRITSGDTWVPLQFQTDPGGATFGGLTDGFGPEIKLGRTVADAGPRAIAIVKFAINATSLAQNWDPDTPGSLYEQMSNEVADAMIGLTALGHTGQVAGFFWMQGSWDARNATDAANYEANLTNFIQRLRIDFADPDLPFVFGRLNENIWMSPYGITPENLATVRAAQEAVAASVPFTALIDTDDLPLNDDYIHFPAAAQLTLGQRLANAYLAVATRAIPTLSAWGLAALLGTLLVGGSLVLRRRRCPPR